MKRLTAILLILVLCLGLASCAAKTPAAPADTDSAVHTIGVIVYNTGDNEVIGFREYLQSYIESNFEMVHFLYSGSIQSSEQELEFIQQACDQGAEGFLSFLSHDLQAEVALCEKNKAYYLLASGTVAAEEFAAVASNPWFLGMFGPGQSYEYLAGVDVARFFVRKGARNIFLLTGGAALGNEMHYQRTLGILDTLASSYGADFPLTHTEMAKSTEPLTVETEQLTITVAPGYVSRENYLASAKEAFAAGTYDAVLSVLPPADMADVVGKTPMGIVDSYNVRNLQLFTNGSLQFLVGKYSSMVGPAFALMLNAVTGYAADFQVFGNAVQVVQGFWTSDSLNDYVDKYALSASAARSAYGFDDLSKVIRIYNPDATLEDLVSLAEACSYEAVQARRSEQPGE